MHRKLVGAVAGLAILLVTGAIAAEPSDDGDGPELSVSWGEKGLVRVISITSTDDRPIIIKNVIINKRANISACNLHINTDPPKKLAPSQQHPGLDDFLSAFASIYDLSGKPMAFADTTDVLASRSCGDPLHVLIVTSVGSATFTFK